MMCACYYRGEFLKSWYKKIVANPPPHLEKPHSSRTTSWKVPSQVTLQEECARSNKSDFLANTKIRPTVGRRDGRLFGMLEVIIMQRKVMTYAGVGLMGVPNKGVG